MTHTLEIETRRREEMIDITERVVSVVRQSGLKSGALVIFVPHTTCAVTINENADPDVRRDITTYLNALVPKNGDYRHFEGNSDSHIKTLLTGNSLHLIVEDGAPLLGRWQGIYFCEYDGPRKRKCLVKAV